MGNCRRDINEAMGLMRDNIVRISDRDAKLHEMQEKSSAFQNTSERFTGQAKSLQWKTRWQHYRFYAFAAVLALWGALLIAFHDHLLVYLPVSAAVLGLLYLAQDVLSKRWSPQVDKTQPLTACNPAE
mmetsp:Transcript_104895/g.326042  ORF Transcript_104895/g.326042 Transcript_104895/m.326042 type:complete len:128 (+) Transcript_104895:641-1024(+)